MIARPALGEQVEKRIGLGDPHAAQNVGAAGEEGVGQHADGRPDDRDAGFGPRQRHQILERRVDQGRAGDQHDIGPRHDCGGLRRRAKERQLVRLECRGVLLQHQKGLPAPLQFLEERDERADHDNLVAGPDFGRVERVDARAQLDFGMRPALPAAFGERVYRGDPDGAADPVAGQRLARQVARQAAAYFARKRHRHRRARAAHRLGDRLDRRGTGAGSAVAELDPGKEQPDHDPLDRDVGELGAEDGVDRRNRLAEDLAAVGLCHLILARWLVPAGAVIPDRIDRAAASSEQSVRPVPYRRIRREPTTLLLNRYIP